METCNGDVSLVEDLYRELTETWLEMNRVCYHKLIFGKPSADYYVDDKSMMPHVFARTNEEDF